MYDITCLLHFYCNYAKAYVTFKGLAARKYIESFKWSWTFSYSR